VFSQSDQSFVNLKLDTGHQLKLCAPSIEEGKLRSFPELFGHFISSLGSQIETSLAEIGVS